MEGTAIEEGRETENFDAALAQLLEAYREKLTSVSRTDEAKSASGKGC